LAAGRCHGHRIGIENAFENLDWKGNGAEGAYSR